LQSQLCACKLSAEVRPSSNQLTAYFENPPAGIDKLIWQQAQADNPHPDCTIPVPLVGFAELKRRKQEQVAFSQQQSAILKQIGEVVQQMKTGQLAISQKLTQLKRKQIEISHRILNVLRRQEVHRRAGFAIRVEEESLRCGLERIWSEITSPRGLRIRFQDSRAALNASTESMSVTEKENVAGLGAADRVTADPRYNWNLDADAWAELKEYLSQRQSGIREIQHLISEMSGTLKIMEDGPTSSAQSGNKLSAKPLSRATPNKVSFALNTRAR
uniref:Nup54 domain-containing protein n=1 Tax=Echinostoma caproni TaxID=27848 RepID=A0A183AT01_9TREM